MLHMRLVAVLPGVQTVRFDYCQFGAAWGKPTTALVLGNPMFKQHESVCTSRGVGSVCTRSYTIHVPLVRHTEDASIDKHVFQTFIAELYPPELCSLRALLITDDYKQRKHGPPYHVQDYNHKIRWSDIGIDCSGHIKRDRLVLSLTNA